MNKVKVISSCQELYKDLVGTRECKFYYNSSFRLDFERMYYENSKYKEVIDKIKSAIKINCIKNGNKYEEICCSGDYLLQILKDKEV